MRHPLLFSAFISLAAFAASACFAAPATVSNPASCPVELSAGQHNGVSLVPAGKAGPPSSVLDSNHAAQSIDLSMKNTRLQRIVAAELEVHGTANKGRMVRTNAVADEPMADAVRNVHLVSSVPADQTRMRTISVKELTSVAWVSVIELRYADGSTWHARPGAECRVTPDPLMLVAGK